MQLVMDRRVFRQSLGDVFDFPLHGGFLLGLVRGDFHCHGNHLG